MSVWKCKKRGCWIAKFQHWGKQYKKEGFRKKREAVLWETQKRQELGAAEPSKEPIKLSFQQLATTYLNECKARMQPNTVRQKAFVFRSFVTYLGVDPQAETVSCIQISHYLNQRAARDGSKAANRDLKELNALYNWSLRLEIINGRNPCSSIQNYPEQLYRPYVPPPEDIDRVRLVATSDERDFIDVLYHLLARRSEIVRLTWEDVNFEQRWVRLYTRKRRGGELEEDYLSMNDTLFAVLSRRWKNRDKSTPYVFQFSDRHLRYMMENLCKRAGVKRFGFHSLRHHVSSILNDSGKASMKQIQKLLRHKRQSTTEKYLHAIDGSLCQAARILDTRESTQSYAQKSR